MIYVTYYWRGATPCVRRIKKGFACTPHELPQELKTASGRGIRFVTYECYSSLEAADTVLGHFVEDGYKDETGCDPDGNKPQPERNHP